MFKGKSLPVGTLVMVLVIMLALLGVGYALWSDTLVIEGTVNTGEVDMAFSPCATNDSGTANDPGYTKHVASCACARSDGTIENPSDDGYDQLNITITDGYPSYSCNVTYDMSNIGTVPVHLYSVFADYDPNALDVEQACQDGQAAPVEIGYQLHPGESVDCSIDLHVRQEAPENDTLYLHKEYWWGQYNEGPPPDVNPECVGEDKWCFITTHLKGYGVRYKDFGNSGDGAVYLGVDDLGVAANRVEGEKTWSIPSTNAVTFTYDKTNDKITETVTGGPDKEYTNLYASAPSTCKPDTADFLWIFIWNSSTAGTVDFKNVDLNGIGLPDFIGTPGGFAQWTVRGFDFDQNFTVSGDLELGGTTLGTGENSKLELLVGCDP
jgi:predicted ribosomally synthesized peptide with SipW-like signal peptide